jgi:hypothetical protein
MALRNAKVGEKVVFSKDKSSTSPGKRAKEVVAAAKGDHYSYIVEKYWVVKEVLPDGSLLLLTRRGKEHLVANDDPRLRRATWFEKLFLQNRFPSPSPPLRQN